VTRFSEDGIEPSGSIKDGPNVVAEWVTLLLRIREVPGSSLRSITGYPTEVFRDFPQCLQVNAGVVP
jgi:hypothetical protein